MLKYIKHEVIAKLRKNLKANNKSIGQEELATLATKWLQNCLQNINDSTPQITRDNIASLETSRKNFDIPTGLALAHILNTTLSSFIRDDIFTLGCFETRLVQHSSIIDDLKYLRRIEYNQPRILIYSHFPSFVYTTETEYINANKEEKKFLLERLENFKRVGTKEYYPLESLLTFGFHVLTSFSIDEKIQVLKTVINFFKNNTRNDLYIISGGQGRSFIDLELISPNLISFSIPFELHHIEIINPCLYDKLNDLISIKQENSIFGSRLEKESSINFLKILLEVLTDNRDRSPLCQLYAFITHQRLTQDIREWIRNDIARNIPHLKELFDSL